MRRPNLYVRAAIERAFRHKRQLFVYFDLIINYYQIYLQSLNAMAAKKLADRREHMLMHHEDDDPKGKKAVVSPPKGAAAAAAGKDGADSSPDGILTVKIIGARRLCEGVAVPQSFASYCVLDFDQQQVCPLLFA